MSEPLWRWHELCTALDLPELDGPDVHGISIDSRTIEAGELFVALSGDPGPRFNPSQRSDRDGHDFIDAALARGAVGVLSHDPVRRDVAELKVADTLDALWALGRAGRARLRCPVVAVTGSSGKTTTKTLLAAALDAFSTSGSLNNHLGVPLSLARTPRTATAAVYEIGTNHPGEIAPLAELVRPDVAVVLNVHPAHAEHFADLDELRREKLSIYKGLSGKGVLITEDLIELDDVLPPALLRCRFGASGGADVRLVGIEGTAAEYAVHGHRVHAHVPAGGVHRARSLAAVLAVMHVLGRELEPALGLADGLIPRGRGNHLTVAGVTLIDDSYNANPESLGAALDGLVHAPATGRRFALLGEMLELGTQSAALHRGLAPRCTGLEHVFCVGAGMRALAAVLAGGRASFWDAPGEPLLDALDAALRPGDTLLVKGSNRVFWARKFVDRITERLAAREDSVTNH